MRFPVWVACCERTLQLLVRRRARHVGLVAVVVLLLIVLFRNVSITNPTEPFLRRSYSSSPGAYGVSVVYTAPASSDNANNLNSDGNSDNGESDEDNTRGDSETSQVDGDGSRNHSDGDDSSVASAVNSSENDENNSDEAPDDERQINKTVARAGPESQDDGSSRVRELPFHTEPDYEAFEWDDDSLDRKGGSPHLASTKNATIPPAILKLMSDALRGEENYTGSEQPQAGKPDGAKLNPRSFINKIVDSLKAQVRNSKDNNFLLRVLDFFGIAIPEDKSNNKSHSGPRSDAQSAKNLSKEEGSPGSDKRKDSKPAGESKSGGEDGYNLRLRSIVASLNLVSSGRDNGTRAANSTWKAVQKERKRLLKSRCNKSSSHQKLKQINAAISANGNTVNIPRAVVDRDRYLLFCPVENAASTMLKRLMYSLERWNRSAEAASASNVSSSEDLPFDVMPSSLSKKGAERFAGNGVKFLLVRDPFVRLFSAYVDHLLVPDVFYWKQWGVTVISRYRRTPSQRSSQCGHDVMFPEFVRYVIETLYASDPLLEPVHAMCAACQFKFSAVGHVETLRDDFEYLTALLGVSVSDYSPDTFADDVSKDAILNSTYGVFQFFKELKPCVSKHEIGKRLWRKFQLTGIISDDLAFPLSLEESVKKNAEDFVQLLLEARDESPNSDKLLIQAFRALKEAYSKVPTEHIVKLVEIYSLDFELFGFSKDPRFLDLDI